MKRPASLGASLGLALVLVGGCAADAAGKDEFAGVCTQRMGSAEKCSCYVDTIEKSLSPDQFAALAQGAHANRDYSGASWIPNTLRADPVISEALSEATQMCFSV